MVSTRAMHHRCTKIKHNTQLIDIYTILAEGARRRHLQPVMTVVPISNIPGVCEMRY